MSHLDNLGERPRDLASWRDVMLSRGPAAQLPRVLRTRAPSSVSCQGARQRPLACRTERPAVRGARCVGFDGEGIYRW